MTLGPLGYYTFLYRINASEVKNRLLLKKQRMSKADIAKIISRNNYSC